VSPGWTEKRGLHPGCHPSSLARDARGARMHGRPITSTAVQTRPTQRHTVPEYSGRYPRPRCALRRKIRICQKMRPELGSHDYRLVCPVGSRPIVHLLLFSSTYPIIQTGEDRAKAKRRDCFSQLSYEAFVQLQQRLRIPDHQAQVRLGQ